MRERDGHQVEEERRTCDVLSTDMKGPPVFSRLRLLSRLFGPCGWWRGCWLPGAVLAISLGVFSLVPAHADPVDGELRIIPLAETDAEYEGRLEIYHDDEWGGICDDFWGIQDARVACKELGYPGATEALRELDGPPNAPMWLDNVDCTGSEESLTQEPSKCDHAGWGPHNPHHCSDQGEHAGVRCTPKTGKNVVFNKRHLTVDEQDSATYQVWLSEAPSADVTVTISGFDGTDVTLSSSSLTFTTGNYSMEQTVTVTAGDDMDDTDDTVTLMHMASGGGYSGTENVTVTVKDNDTPGVSVNPKDLTIGEGTDDSYTVVLTGEPTAGVTITVSGHADPSVSVDSASLMFTTTNWNMAQTVTVTAHEDTDSDSETVTLTHSASGGGYDTVPIDSVTVQVQDNDIRAPDRVARPTVTGQSTTELEVSWTAPANNGAVITTYEVEYRQVGTNTWSTRTLTGITSQPHAWRLRLTGLGLYTSYEVRVRAKNEEGFGEWSPLGMGRTLAAAPDRPGAPTVEAESATRLEVSWTAPADNGAPITGYDVQYRQVGTPDWERWNHTGSGTRTEISGLRAGTTYYVQVRAKNAGGRARGPGPGAGLPMVIRRRVGSRRWAGQHG